MPSTVRPDAMPFSSVLCTGVMSVTKSSLAKVQEMLAPVSNSREIGGAADRLVAFGGDNGVA